MKDDEILKSLQTAIIAAIGDAQPSLANAIQAVGRTLNPRPDDQKWFEFVFLPNNVEGAFWGDETNYQGSFRLILHWPNSDEGAYLPMAVLRSVCEVFPNGRMIGAVQISGKPNFGGPVEAGAELLYPVTLRYTSFRT